MRGLLRFTEFLGNVKNSRPTKNRNPQVNMQAKPNHERVPSITKIKSQMIPSQKIIRARTGSEH
jgi:hypothetical protein